MMIASRETIMLAFEEAYADKLTFDKIKLEGEGEAYFDWHTATAFGTFMAGWRACEDRDPNITWQRTRGQLPPKA